MIESAKLPRRTSAVTMALCYLIAVFEGFDLQAAGVAAPKLGPALGLTPDQLAWFFSSSTFGLMIGAAVGGRLSDRFGRKSVLIWAVSIFGLMSIGTGLAHNFELLLAMRFLTGVGLGGALPNLVALTAENAPAHEKNTAVGLLYAGLPSGGALVSLLSIFGAVDNWQIVFHVGGIAPLLAVPLLIMVLPESRELKSQRAAAAEVTGPKHGGFYFALFQEGRAGRSILLWVAFFLALLTMYLLLNWLPTLLVGRGLSRPDASLVQLTFNVFGAVASLCTGLAMDRLSLRWVTIVSFASAAVALALLSAAPPQLVIAATIGGLVGVAMSATQALLYAIAPANYPTKVRGTGVGTAVTIGRLGSAAGPLLAAALLGSGRSPTEVLSVLIPIILVSGAATFVLVLLMARQRTEEPR